MEMNRTQNDEIEIDLKQLFKVLLKKIWLILLVAILFAAGAGFYTKRYMIPQYQSTSMLYILGKSSSIVSLSDLQLGSQLTNDYLVLVESRPVVEEVIENLGLDMNYETMVKKISISNQADTRIIKITVTDEDPVRAKDIANEFAQVAKKRMAEIMATDEPTVVEEGYVNDVPISPSLKKNCALAGILGAALVCMILIVIHLMNDTIKTSDDIDKYLGLATLGTIPMDGKRRKKKNRR